MHRHGQKGTNEWRWIRGVRRRQQKEWEEKEDNFTAEKRGHCRTEEEEEVNNCTAQRREENRRTVKGKEELGKTSVLQSGRLMSFEQDKGNVGQEEEERKKKEENRISEP